MANYFQPRNLTALREMALLWLADQVEVALQRYRADQQVTDIWETRERVVVALTGGPESETVLRRAARIAERTESAELFAVHVLRGDGLAGAPVGALAALRRLAENVGASFHTVVGEDVPTALLEFARGVDATQLVIGTSRRSRAARVLAEGIGSRVVAGLRAHRRAHGHPPGGGPRDPAPPPVQRRPGATAGRSGGRWGCCCRWPRSGPASSAAACSGCPPTSSCSSSPTVVSALVGGLGPALLAAVASGLMLNFFLTPPLYTFTISERENIVTLVVMVLVAVLVALVVDRAARRAQQAAQARAEATLLASFSRTVLTRADPLPRLLTKIREAFGLTSVAILERRDGRWEVSACAGPRECDRPEQADVDVAVDPDTHLVGRGRALAAAERRLLDAVAGQALLALRNQQVSTEAADARRRADATELRTALLSAVGHDLRTPLTSIKAAAGSLRDPDLELSESDRTELAATIEESADRLTGVVNNLLDSSRIATGAVTPELQPVRYDEVALLALRGLDDLDRVHLDLADDLPEVLADPGLLERVVANLVDNALRHGAGQPRHAARQRPPGGRRPGTQVDRVELRVVDAGPGVPRGESDRLFAPFQRLGDREPRGLGLGLSVASGFTEAMGGTLTAEDTPGGGLTMAVSLPACPRPRPVVAPEPRRARRARAVTRVLIVDDDTQLLRALRINLTARGYTVLTAADGRTALRAAAERQPDVVVLDLGLPDLDGTDVITELRTFTRAPIIVLSARTDSTDKVHALDRGADDYVTKPFGVEELTARLRAAVRRATATVAAGAGRRAAPGRRPHDRPRRARSCAGTGSRSASRPPSGASSSCSRATTASSSAAASSCTTSGVRASARRPATCASTSPSCGSKLERDPAHPRHLSPRPGWATGSAPEGSPGASIVLAACR